MGWDPLGGSGALFMKRPSGSDFCFVLLVSAGRSQLLFRLQSVSPGASLSTNVSERTQGCIKIRKGKTKKVEIKIIIKHHTSYHIMILLLRNLLLSFERA